MTSFNNKKKLTYVIIDILFYQLKVLHFQLMLLYNQLDIQTKIDSKINCEELSLQEKNYEGLN